MEIQRGARMFLPPEILGAHISASPNHQTHRRHTLSFRAIVTLAYHFGVELNPLTHDDAERAELKGWIALHKRLRPVLHDGLPFHNDPQDGRYVWGAIDGSRAVVIIAQATQMMTEQPPPIAVRGLEHSKQRWRSLAAIRHKPDFIRITPEQQRLLDGESLSLTPCCRAMAFPFPCCAPSRAWFSNSKPVEGT